MADLHKYRLVYHVEEHPEGLTKEQLEARPDGWKIGACDALLMCSMIYPANGSFSVFFIGHDGRVQDQPDLDEAEWFKVWTLLAHRLGQSRSLDPGKAAFAQAAFESWREILLAARDSPPKEG